MTTIPPMNKGTLNALPPLIKGSAMTAIRDIDVAARIRPNAPTRVYNATTAPSSPIQLVVLHPHTLAAAPKLVVEHNPFARVFGFYTPKSPHVLHPDTCIVMQRLIRPVFASMCNQSRLEAALAVCAAYTFVHYNNLEYPVFDIAFLWICDAGKYKISAFEHPESIRQITIGPPKPASYNDGVSMRLSLAAFAKMMRIFINIPESALLSTLANQELYHNRMLLLIQNCEMGTSINFDGISVLLKQKGQALFARPPKPAKNITANLRTSITYGHVLLIHMFGSTNSVQFSEFFTSFCKMFITTHSPIDIVSLRQSIAPSVTPGLESIPVVTVMTLNNTIFYNRNMDTFESAEWTPEITLIIEDYIKVFVANTRKEQTIIGNMHLSDPLNFDSAIPWFRLAAGPHVNDSHSTENVPDKIALYNLAYCYKSGFGCAKSAHEYHHNLLKSAQSGLPHAINDLAMFQMSKSASRQEEMAALDMLTVNSKCFDASKYNLAYYMHFGTRFGGYRADFGHATRLYEECGLAVAKFRLSQLLYSRKLELLIASSNEGYIPAFMALVEYYKGVDEDAYLYYLRLSTIYNNPSALVEHAEKLAGMDKVKILEQAGEMGAVDAWFALAIHVSDKVHSRIYLERGIRFSSSKCLHELGVRLGDSIGLDMIETAARQLNLSSLIYLGNYNEALDVEKALYYYETAYMIHNHYPSGTKVALLKYPNSPTVSISIYRKLSKLGDAHSQYELATHYRSGKDVIKNYKLSFEIMQASASQNYSAALIALSMYHLHGVGTSKSSKKAFLVMKKCVEETKDPNATYLLAEMHEKGIGTNVDSYKCIELYRISAPFNQDAKYNLAKCYLGAKGVPRHPATCISHLRANAEKGHFESTLLLGILHMTISPDFGIARMYFEKAAMKGSGIAMNQLGLMFFFGHGVEQSVEVAASWFRMGAAVGIADSSCIVNLERIDSGLLCR